MATYSYRCTQDGSVDMSWSIGAAPDTAPCPNCGETCARVFTPPLLALADRSRMALIDRAAASAVEPTVVSSPPPRPGPARGAAPRRPDPRTSRLPRP